MLPLNIDLTENRDFNDPSRRTYIDFSRMIEFSREVDNTTKMTGEEFEALMRVESIFGRRTHENRRWYIFGGKKVEDDLEQCCEMCGKRIMPYEKKKNFGVCDKCNNMLRYGYNHMFFPWCVGGNTNGPLSAREIFQLR